jgi:hypothetical protein
MDIHFITLYYHVPGTELSILHVSSKSWQLSPELDKQYKKTPLFIFFLAEEGKLRLREIERFCKGHRAGK